MISFFGVTFGGGMEQDLLHWLFEENILPRLRVLEGGDEGGKGSFGGLNARA